MDSLATWLAAAPVLRKIELQALDHGGVVAIASEPRTFRHVGVMDATVASGHGATPETALLALAAALQEASNEQP